MTVHCFILWDRDPGRSLLDREPDRLAIVFSQASRKARGPDPLKLLDDRSDDARADRAAAFA
ncbi:hypothetical protein, partial [Methylocystis sp. MJC1]|uniref:hypothetical protein n=1 Tax=Methylocystis sp. MJC1 TaxID=2654282 RepID=UPI0019D28335